VSVDVDLEPATPEQQEKLNKLLSEWAGGYVVDLHGLSDDLESDSPLQMLLRGHLYVEAEMVALLAHGVKKPDILRLDRMQFERKIKLAVALGLLDEYWMPALLQLNKERNKLAHHLDHHVTGETGRVILRAIPNAPDVEAAISGPVAECEELKLVIRVLVAAVAKQRAFIEVAAYLKPKPGFPN
jgi:hypothetical protein